MTPHEAIVELLARIGARNGEAVLVSAEELHQWPAAAVATMKSQKLLTRARPAKSVVCPGCERACTMPVQTLTWSNGTAASFVVCDKRNDINRVAISADQITQWRCDAEAVCGFVASSLGIRPTEQRSNNPILRTVGLTRGNKRSQMLALKVAGELTLVVGNNSIPLDELVSFCEGKYTVDANTTRQLVDSSTSSDPRYTPSNARREARNLDTQAMYEEWRKEYRTLKKQRPNMSDVWYSRQIAKMGSAVGRNAETIRKHMKN